MLKKQVIVFICFICLVGCKKESEIEKATNAMNMSLQIERFDQILYGSSPQDIPTTRQNYPAFFSKDLPDSLYASKVSNPIYQELFQEVQSQFPTIVREKEGVETLLKNIKYYFPNEQIPTKMFSLVSEMDYQNKVIYTDSVLILSLDLYLGSEHRYYVGEFYDYQRMLFTPAQILPDFAAAFAERKIPRNPENTFVSQMITEGKAQYLKQILLPETPPQVIMGYSEAQYNWCLDNEMYMWKFFVDNDLLFDTSPKNSQRFIAEAPFSKFYLEIDAQSPGRVGIWIGWQIVKAYMEKTNISTAELLVTEPKIIFENAKYKPKK
jgi:gliding motility-associated lipoprotein GldB